MNKEQVFFVVVSSSDVDTTDLIRKIVPVENKPDGPHVTFDKTVGKSTAEITLYVAGSDWRSVAPNFSSSAGAILIPKATSSATETKALVREVTCNVKHPFPVNQVLYLQKLPNQPSMVDGVQVTSLDMQDQNSVDTWFNGLAKAALKNKQKADAQRAKAQKVQDKKSNSPEIRPTETTSLRRDPSVVREGCHCVIL
eukprot:m.42547 g.42547  ORF g.42547 m.42547 type:complete len:197 (+) comp17015_c0_seq2:138-728(+)